VNTSLEDKPETLNQDPYGEGWLVKIKLIDPAEAKELMSADEYSLRSDNWNSSVGGVLGPRA